MEKSDWYRKIWIIFNFLRWYFYIYTVYTKTIWRQIIFVFVPQINWFQWGLFDEYLMQNLFVFLHNNSNLLSHDWFLLTGEGDDSMYQSFETFHLCLYFSFLLVIVMSVFMITDSVQFYFAFRVSLLFNKVRN